tara:strand:- start:493 stop:1047 length:555 start_codon:yes stop_codon:yes gene_type:complete
MSTYKIDISKPVPLYELNESIGIFVYRATRIPPHLGLFINGRVYDITAVGPTLGLDLNSFYQSAVKRKMEVLFIGLDDVKLSNLYNLENRIEASVRKHEMVSELKSCLAPILEVLDEICTINTNTVQFFFDLYPQLQEKQLIKFTSQLGLEAKIKGNVLALKKYTQEDIKDCIAALDRKSNLVC